MTGYPNSPDPVLLATVEECLAALKDAHEDVASAAIDWPDDGPMAALHELDDAEQLLGDAEACVVRARRSLTGGAS